MKGRSLLPRKPSINGTWERRRSISISPTIPERLTLAVVLVVLWPAVATAMGLRCLGVLAPPQEMYHSPYLHLMDTRKLPCHHPSCSVHLLLAAMVSLLVLARLSHAAAPSVLLVGCGCGFGHGQLRHWHACKLACLQVARACATCCTDAVHVWC